MTFNSHTRHIISWFAQSLIAGDLGPDDSRDGRAQLFLNDPSIVGQAMEIFLYWLELDDKGDFLDSDKAEHRVAGLFIAQLSIWNTAKESPADASKCLSWSFDSRKNVTRGNAALSGMKCGNILSPTRAVRPRSAFK